MNIRTIGTKQMSALVLAVAIVVTAGCSSNSGDSGQSSAEPKGSKAPSEVKTAASGHFNLWMGWTATVNNESMIQESWKTGQPGIDVQLEATQGDAVTALNLKLNTGGFEDAAIFNRNTVVEGAMKRSGQIQPLEKYFNMPDKYPSLALIPKQYLDKMKDADGHIWSIPSAYDVNPSDPWPGWSSSAWFIRTDILEKAGMSENDLKTIKGIETYLEKASQLKDDSGKPLLPLGVLLENNDENTILATFGVTVGSAGGVIPVAKNGDGFVLQFDNPGYKAAYKWMNEMYHKGYIDPEALTDKPERYKEKNKSGRFAMNVGSFWNFDQNLWEPLDGPTGPGWFYKPIPYPKVDGVSQLGTTQVVNPYPTFDTYINKNTKNLDAILKFYDYTLTPNPEQGHIVNEGPVGKYWNWADQPYGKWKYTESDYRVLRNSGDPATKAKATPELWQTTNFSKKWYPWWNVGEFEHPGWAKTAEFTTAINKMGTTRVAENYDMVKAKVGGVWEKYMPELDNVRKEYRAKLLVAKNEAQFEKAWSDFNQALEQRAHWSQLKQEWNQLYQAMPK